MKPPSKIYLDEIHGFRALASSRAIAWQLIRNECYEKRVQVPTLEQIKFLKKLK